MTCEEHKHAPCDCRQHEVGHVIHNGHVDHTVRGKDIQVAHSVHGDHVDHVVHTSHGDHIDHGVKHHEKDFGLMRTEYGSLAWKHLNWPLIIVIIIGVVVIVYSIADNTKDIDQKSFAIFISVAWTLISAFVMWIMWGRQKYKETWWLLMASFAVFILILVLLIVLGEN